jgi:predicted nucleic acid-binding protein
VVNAYFLDSSALVKRYVEEIGSSWILSITNSSSSNHLYVVEITLVEALSAIGRRQREGNLSGEQVNVILEDIRFDFQNVFQIIEIDQNLIDVAGELVLQYPLRAYDAIQLASALQVRALLTSFPEIQLTFVSADDRLLNIAQTETLLTENPNNYPDTD